MRYPEVTSAITPSFSTNDALEAPARNRQRFGTIDAARRAATPHLATCDGLSRTTLKKPGQFEQELSARVRWCEKYASGDFEIESVESGLRFRFARIAIVNLFRIWFETDLRSRSMTGQ
jgi:hypothetical protein